MASQSLYFKKYVKQYVKKNRLYQLGASTLQASKNPLNEWAIAQNFVQTWQETAPYRVEPKNVRVGEAGNVVIGFMEDFIYLIKMYGVLTYSLKMAGYRPIAYLSKRSLWAKRYFKAFGVQDFIYWEDLTLSLNQIHKCQNQANDLLKEELDFQQVKNWKVEGCWIGPQLLSSIVRDQHLGAPDPKNPAVRTGIQNNLPLVLENIEKAKLLYEKTDPKAILLIEPNGMFTGPVVDLAIQQKRQVLWYTQPARDDALILRRLIATNRRDHPNSLTPESLARIKKIKWDDRLDQDLFKELDLRYNGKWHLQSRNQPGVSHFTKEEIIKKFDLDPGKKLAVVFSHVLWDANLFFGEDLFDDYGHWFVETVKAACANTNINWLIKLHPANKWKRARDGVDQGAEMAEETLIRENIGTLPSHVRLIKPDTEISTLSLFKSTDYGITVRGTIGIELPCFGVTTLTAGTGRYSGLGITLDSHSQKEFLDKLAKLQEIPAMSAQQIDLAKKHAYAIFKWRPWIMTSAYAKFDFSKSAGRLFDHDVGISVPNSERLDEQDDNIRLAKWYQDQEQIDYLNADFEKQMSRREEPAAMRSPELH